MERVRGLLPRSGTILGTSNRGNPFSYPVENDGRVEMIDVSQRVVDNFRKIAADALIRGRRRRNAENRPAPQRDGGAVVGVPKTIDNDLRGTEVTFGYNTAVEVVTEALDRLHTTAQSHHRVMVVEVMGRDAGWIAPEAGIAGSAYVILIP